MSTRASWLERVDPRLREQVSSEAGRPGGPVALVGHVVLVGHRGAGKSALLEPVAAALGRRTVDLDALISERAGVSARALFERGEREFRAAERAAFLSIEGEAVVAAGGGFLAHHADLLRGHTPVLVPVTFETYRDRMRADASRPRLMPAVSLDEEIEAVFREREALHAQVPTLPLAAVMQAPVHPERRPKAGVEGRRGSHVEPMRLQRRDERASTPACGLRSAQTGPVLVVTLPRGVDPVAFAERAQRLGADALEVRDDLTPDFDAEVSLPLLLAHRGGSGFRAPGRWVDGPGGDIASFHAAAPMTPREAVAHWSSATAPFIKHVEPDPDARLLETQRLLIERFGEGRVTVLGTGDCALPWRAVLAERNAFDYLALDAATASAAGQRLLTDAVRAGHATGNRLAIIGSGIAGSRSPRLHPQPFDRWDLPADAPVRQLVDDLRAHYRGFVVTAPFKQRFTETGAINTLIRRPDGWQTANTDLDGARAVLTRHRVGDFTVLGDGGAAWALRKVAGPRARVLKAAEARPVRGDAVWTWPEHLATPHGLDLDGARVLVIAYGPAALRLSARITQLGGTPVRAGATWFIAQARAQRRLWQEAV